MIAVRLRRAAKADIRDIRTYTVRAWGRTQAKQYLAGLQTHMTAIAEKPLLKPSVDGPVEGLRRSRYGQHIVIYLPLDDGIDVVRILHQRMDVDAQLGA